MAVTIYYEPIDEGGRWITPNPEVLESPKEFAILDGQWIHTEKWNGFTWKRVKSIPVRTVSLIDWGEGDE